MNITKPFLKQHHQYNDSLFEIESFHEFLIRLQKIMVFERKCFWLETFNFNDLYNILANIYIILS